MNTDGYVEELVSSVLGWKGYGLDCGKEVNRVGLCLSANNRLIKHAEIRMIDQNKKAHYGLPCWRDAKR